MARCAGNCREDDQRMRRQLSVFVLAAAMAGPGFGASLTLSGLVDGDDGKALDLDGSLPLTDAWLVGAGIGRSKSSLEGNEFTATSLRASTDVQIGSGFANAAV